jgi:hypothetical protein
MGKEEPGDSHPIINEWGGAWASGLVRMVWATSEPDVGNLHMRLKFSLLLGCLTCKTEKTPVCPKNQMQLLWKFRRNCFLPNWSFCLLNFVPVENVLLKITFNYEYSILISITEI